MFGKNNIKLDMVATTSKMALKASCIRACNGDVEKAEKLYDFFAKDISNLPDFDAPVPTALDQIKGVVGEVFGWVDQNQDKIVGAYNFIQSVRGGTPINIPAGAPPSGIPPIPE
jgi:hypothetical protein